MNKGVFFVFVSVLSLTACSLVAAEDFAGAAGVQGGFVVFVGCEDGKMLTSLGAREGFVVQGLSDDPDAVTTAREQVRRPVWEGFGRAF